MLTVNLSDTKSYTAGSGLVFYSNSEFSYIVTNHHVAGYGCKNIGDKCEDLNIRFGFEWNNISKVFNAISKDALLITDVILDYDNAVQDIAVIRFKTKNLKFNKVNIVTQVELIPETGDFFSIGFPIISLRYQLLLGRVKVTNI